MLPCPCSSESEPQTGRLEHVYRILRLTLLHVRTQPVEAIHDVKHMLWAQGASVSLVQIVEVLVSELLILQDHRLKSLAKFVEQRISPSLKTLDNLA